MNNDVQSTETKLKMASALIDLIKIKPFSKITIGDIVSHCEINRNTFYYHFENIYDLLYWTYSNEIQTNLITLFQQANADITQGIEFMLSYIDNNLHLCQTAYESLGENELKNMFERDMKAFISALTNYFCSQKNKIISNDYKDFINFNFAGMLSAQIVWYIKYNEQIDKPKFLDYMQTTFLTSLCSTIEAGGTKNL